MDASVGLSDGLSNRLMGHGERVLTRRNGGGGGGGCGSGGAGAVRHVIEPRMWVVALIKPNNKTLVKMK